MVSGASAGSQHAERRHHEQAQGQRPPEHAPAVEDGRCLRSRGGVFKQARQDADDGGDQDADDDDQRPDTEREVQRFDYLSGGQTSGTQPSADHHVMYVWSC